MLYLIGLGLGDLEDIGLRGLKVAQQAARVYLEMYTSILHGADGGIPALESLLGRKVIPADREMLEEKADEILADADKVDVAMLIVGDPMAATTHSDLVLRARNQSVPVKIIHNASIISAVGSTGLQVYRFGLVVSIVFWTETWRPRSFAGHISANLQRGLHTLCLLDIKVKEPNMEALLRGKKVYDPPRYMTVSQAAQQLMEIVEKPESQEEGSGDVIRNVDVRFTGDTPCVSLARLGLPDEKMVAGRLSDMVNVELGGPLHSLILCGELHPLEKDFLKQFALNDFLAGSQQHE